MANRDIAGLLTGISSQGIDPLATLTPEQQRMQMGAQAAQRMGGGLRGLMGGGATPQQQIQQKISQDVQGFDTKTIDEQKKLVRILQASGQNALAAQLANQVAINEQKAEAKAEAGAKATRTANIRTSIVNRMGDDSQYADIKPLVEAGAFDNDFPSLIKTLTQPSDDKKLSKLYSATDGNGNDIIVAVQSQKGQDDKLVTIDGSDVPKGTVLKAGGTKVAVNLNSEEETALNKELGKLKASAVMESYKEANKAQIGSQVIDDQWDIVSSKIGVISGATADFKLGAARVLKAVGLIGGDDSDTDQLIENTETYVANAGNLVARVIKEFGAGTGLSDADREFAQKIVAGTLTLDAKSMKKLIKLQARAVRRQIEEHNKTVAKLTPSNQAALSVEVPEFSWAYDQPQESEVPDDIQSILDELTPSGPR
ncbi:hypothetical protein OAE72_00635 [Akkermansiaceae bacterium]|nr:hypothetical protein [Akkermansiaceae bacterium]